MATPKQPDLGCAYVDLYWIPLGAGGWFVRRHGRAFEALVALKERRPRQDLYHSALEVAVPEGRFTIEQTPVPSGDDARGVVAGGAVGARWAGRFRIFRYEVRCWRDGRIPDMTEAVELQLDHLVAPQYRRGGRRPHRAPARGRALGWHAGLAVARRREADVLVT